MTDNAGRSVLLRRQWETRLVECSSINVPWPSTYMHNLYTAWMRICEICIYYGLMSESLWLSRSQYCKTSMLNVTQFLTLQRHLPFTFVGWLYMYIYMYIFLLQVCYTRFSMYPIYTLNILEGASICILVPFLAVYDISHRTLGIPDASQMRHIHLPLSSWGLQNVFPSL